MQTLVIMWQPNDKWHALPSDEKKNYLLSLDTAVNEARSHLGFFKGFKLNLYGYGHNHKSLI